MNNDIYFIDISKNKFSKTVNKDVPLLINEYSVIESIKNILMTNKGEKPYDPEFGCNALDKYLFEPLTLTTAFALKSEIELSLTKNEPRIDNLNVICTLDYDNNDIIIEIIFTIKTSPKEIKFETSLKKIR